MVIRLFLCTDGFYNVAEDHMTDMPIEEIKKKISAQHDASFIKIS